MFSRKKREFPFYSTETGGTEQMYEMWSDYDYSLTNIANQVMNLLPFALTQHQQNIKNSSYNIVVLTRYISAMLSEGET